MQCEDMKKEDSKGNLNTVVKNQAGFLFMPNRGIDQTETGNPAGNEKKVRIIQKVDKTKLRTTVGLLEKLLLNLKSRKTRYGVFIVISLVFHFIVIESFYHLSQIKKNNTQMPEKISFKIIPAKEPAEIKKVNQLQPTKKMDDKKKPEQTKKNKKRKLKYLSAKQLEALGKKNMNKVRAGQFPSLVLSYHNPSVFIKEMYSLGCKTVLYDKSHQDYYGIDLFSSEILPLSKNDFQGFSNFKRVIEDTQWHAVIKRMSARLNTLPGSLEILLLVPTSVEARWIGHQVNIFRQLKIKITKVETVETLFLKNKLRIVRAYLKDGSSRIIDDHIGV